MAMMMTTRMIHPRHRRSDATQRGVVLVQVYLVVAILVILSLAVASYALTEFRVSQAHQRGVQAFYVAEAGLDHAISELRNDFTWSDGFSDEPYGDEGSYSVTVEQDGDLQVLTSTGTIAAGVAGGVQRQVQAVVRKMLLPNFFDNAIYSSGDVIFNGNAYEVQGNVLSGDTNSTIDNTGNVDGNVVYDETADPLPRFNFEQLYDLASEQGNVYDAERLHDIQTGQDSFPPSFWRTPLTDPTDPTTGVPNVVYVTTDLALNGNIGTIGGFFVVVGDVLTDPSASEDATLNGNGIVDGPIYTRGEFRINGGAGRLNINGGVWAGVEARLNGNATVSNNREYMDALRQLLQADVEVVLWREGVEGE